MYWVTGIIGVVLMMAPYMLGYGNNSAAVGTSLTVGLATILVSFVEAVQEDKGSWEYWTAVVLGLLAIAAPFVLGFSNHAVAMWTTVGAGMLIAVFAGGRLSSGHWGET